MPAPPPSALAMYATLFAALLGSYLLGSVPVAYVIVKLVTGEDITQHGTGNVGSMNVRRTTGSWAWFCVAVLGDGLKGLVPVVLTKGITGGFAVASILTPVSARRRAPRIRQFVGRLAPTAAAGRASGQRARPQLLGVGNAAQA